MTRHLVKLNLATGQPLDDDYDDAEPYDVGLYENDDAPPATNADDAAAAIRELIRTRNAEIVAAAAAAPELDTSSPASRQHYIDTGRYLTVGEAWSAHEDEPVEAVEGTGGEVWDEPDLVDQPPHYLAHPSGVECIEVTEHMTFCLGNAVKYIWRAGLKGDRVRDLQKAAWYLEREIGRLQGTLYRQTMGESR